MKFAYDILINGEAVAKEVAAIFVPMMVKNFTDMFGDEEFEVTVRRVKVAEADGDQALKVVKVDEADGDAAKE